MGDRRLKRDFELPSPAEVIQYERKYQGSRYEPRVTLLRQLLGDRERSVADLARACGVSPHTVSVYLQKLRHSGVEGLLSDRQKCRLTAEQREELREKLLSGELSSYAETIECVRDTWGVTYSESGIRTLIGRKLGLVRCFSTRGGEKRTKQSEYSDIVINRRLREFANNLPTSQSFRSWVIEFREALYALLPSVTHASVAILSTARLDSLSSGDAHHSFAYLDSEGPKLNSESILYHRRKRGTEGEIRNESVDDSMKDVLKALRNMGTYSPTEHSCLIWAIRAGQENLLGRILLLYPKNSRYMTSDLQLLEKISPFLAFCMVEGRMRIGEKPAESELYYERVVRVAKKEKLSKREREVFIPYALGVSREQIAQQLGVSVSSVKNHIGSIHRKIGIHSQTQATVYVNSPARNLEAG